MLRDAGGAIAPSIEPFYQYVKHLGSAARPDDATYDIGAFEYALPYDVEGLLFDSDRRTLRWSAVPGARSYDVLRGSLPVTGASCFVAATALTSADDPSSPPAGGYWYLVRGSDCGGLAGTLGPGPDGALGTTCP